MPNYFQTICCFDYYSVILVIVHYSELEMYSKYLIPENLKQETLLATIKNTWVNKHHTSQD